MWQHITHPLSLLAILNGLCLIASRQVTKVEILQKTTCEKVYKKALDSRGELDFSNAIGNLTCSPGPSGYVRYHCMSNEDGHDLQFCTEWIWIEPDLCPRLYSVQSIINPEKCDINGCPKDRYQSHMYYNFSVCFNKVSDKISSKHSSDKDNKDETSSTGIIVGVVLAVFAVVGIGIFIGIFIYCRGKGVIQQVRSRPLSEAQSHLRNGTCILLTGKKGEGVTTFIKDIHRTYFSDHKWKERDYGFDRIHLSKKIFLVISERNLGERKEWRTLKNLIVNKERETKIVIVVPRSSYNSLRNRLQGECHGAIEGIDLSSDRWKMDEDQRSELIDKWMKYKKIDTTQLPEHKKRQIVHYESKDYGFCYLCDSLFDGKREDVIDKLTDVEKALKNIEEGISPSKRTESDKLKMKLLQHSK